ncbi:hypothetical protein EDD28_1974 [Salana multivorans]|uniref:DUF5709 domain-containing protein n=1 Tax=Salana multivorans TaxID=120377 RepID=A0A3N2DC66_9MICO|nr:DUF5709 domain-containing protein [Salana multivorans]MBN8883448.1 hypothetical protein [Salana multivorans]ROR97376.1 hypothetical protein EDD28_1974 [Salana multivorans]
MSENQFGNGVDPESFDDFDDIEDQLQPEDTLEQSRVDDSLDEGFIPPDEDRRSRWGETALEEELGEPLDLRLAQELPDVWVASSRGQEMDRSGRIEGVTEGSFSQDSFARDVGVAGGAASAEEAAVHTISLEELQNIERLEAEGVEPDFEDDGSV